ncbi:alpha-L-glycero-D-manno-heptose beta-1,4-glucosyltransferase [Rhodoferax lacus]|uniref:Alpha-L-glycero-D-manno-heptose beta-1,4-glucosyltransferase n=1 Tax=Rhodoferax lacus TaxID=2184758 RepID=A0A3E1RH36_9BURK|nr:glycosyltransferase family 2 protein [Rhodoferax lacus]RFO98668.1 alpha-L-glycero-D-manno-heptose beta-1,4-glucosyltransferase [Rhodoferax lacus]
MPLVSVYIIAFNESEKVRATIESARWADEIIVVDSWSTDGTAEIATGMGARVVQVDFKGFGDLRNQAIAACSHEWIFSLDADERCTPEAAEEVRKLINDPNALDAYRTPRRNFFMGRWIKHSGWYPNYRQPQLFRKGKMCYDQKPVHEGYELIDSAKPVGHMTNAIWQFPFKNMAEVMHKANRYSSLGAEKIKHKKISMGSALAHGLWSFAKHYVFKLGFLDGWAGFVIALGNFEGTFYRYAKALEIQKGAQWSTPTDTPSGLNG